MNQSKTRGARGGVRLAAAFVLGAGALGAIDLGCSTEETVNFGDPACVAGRCESGPAGPGPTSTTAAGGSSDCLMGAGAGGAGGGGNCPSWDQLFTDIFDADAPSACASDSCHSGSITSDLVLVPKDPKASRLALLTYQMKDPAGPLISCTDVSSSKILCNLSQTDTCGQIMPKLLPKLDQTQIDMIAEWITCGAPDN